MDRSRAEFLIERGQHPVLRVRGHLVVATIETGTDAAPPPNEVDAFIPPDALAERTHQMNLHWMHDTFIQCRTNDLQTRRLPS